MVETVTEWVGMALILGFTAWGVGGFVASFAGLDRSRLRTWWSGSRYGSVGEPHAGPVIVPDRQPGEARR